MKILFKCFAILFLISLMINVPCLAQVYGVLTDSRDGKRYKTIKVDKFEIMAENLKFDKAGICYDMEDLFCSDYGRLYDFEDVSVSLNGICPVGWHIPSAGEWKYIFTKLSGKITNTESGFTLLNLSSNPLNFVFSGYGNGERTGYVSFFGLKETGFFASSTKTHVVGNIEEWDEWMVVRFEKNEIPGQSNYKYNYFLFGTSLENNVSCRCIKDYKD